MDSRRLILAVLATTLLHGCGDDINLPTASLMEIVPESNNQLATAGDRVARPLAVRVLAADASTPVPRAEVSWTVTGGAGATLSDAMTVSDGNGEAQVSVTLGPEPGTYRIEAALVSRPVVNVSLTAVATTPPRLQSVDPATFSSGDTVRLQGTGLDGTLTIEIGGVAARIVGTSATKTVLSVAVPGCVVPGVVSVAARVGFASSQVTGTYLANQSLLQLLPGEYLSVDPVTLDGCATFPPAGPNGAEYLLTPQSVTGTPGLSGPFRLKGDSVAPPVTAPEPEPSGGAAARAFHDFLRQEEAAAAREPRSPYIPEPRLATASAGIAVGETRTFRVCNSITCSAVPDFTSVTARAEYVGRYAVLFLDRNAPAGLTAADIETLGARFDDDLYGVGTRAFGAESDVDRNNRVFVLLTPVVNQLTPKEECATQFITGFFFSIDTDPIRVGDERSNQAEIFYAIVPDPNGTFTCQHSVDRIRRVVPVTFAHEFQHLISFYQHVILRSGSNELTWLNEAMSHYAEEAAGQHFRAKGDTASFVTFSFGNLFNAYQFLSAPQASAPLFMDGAGTLAERGAGWLFLRWLVDQFGADLPRRLSETGESGADNIVRATGRPLSALLSQWFLANYVSDLPDFTTPARLSYATWNLREVYQSLHEQLPDQFTRPFPVASWDFTGGTFDLLGTLRSGTGDYVRVGQLPDQSGFTVKLLGAGGGPLSGPFEPRLNVIRLR